MSRSFEAADRDLRARHLAVLRARRRRHLPAAAPRGPICRAPTARSAIPVVPAIFIAVGRRVRRQLADQRADLNSVITFAVILAGLPVYQFVFAARVARADESFYDDCVVFLIASQAAVTLFFAADTSDEHSERRSEDGCTRAASAAPRIFPALARRRRTGHRRTREPRGVRRSRPGPPRPPFPAGWPARRPRSGRPPARTEATHRRPARKSDQGA